MIDRLRDLLRRRRTRHRHRCADVEQGVAYPGQKVEQDVPVDPGVARTRATGGAPNGGPGPTGTQPTGTFVGRVAGEDPGYHDQTGAEARAEGRAARHGPEQGPARGADRGADRGRERRPDGSDGPGPDPTGGGGR